MKVRLEFSHENVKKPILSEIIMETKVPMNILDAKVTQTEAEMVVDIPLEGERLKETLDLFQKAGVGARAIFKTIEIDKTKCTSCGACVSPCPVSALQQDVNWDIEFDEELCIGCGICVQACPVRIITML